MSNEAETAPVWVSLPPLEGGVFVGMVTEVLDTAGIPNMVKTDLCGGGLGVVIGTSVVGRPWRIQVPEQYYQQALEVFEGLMGSAEDEDLGPDSPV